MLRLSSARLDISGRLASAVAREQAGGSLFNFVPVALGLGILLYFAAPSEPSGLALAGTALAAAALARRIAVHGVLYHALAAVALVLVGMTAAKVRTVAISSPVVTGEMTSEITGLVVSVDSNARGAPRYVIRPQSIAGLEANALPERIRLSASAARTDLSTGDGIAGKARIMPISGPAYPGGYDFNFFARYDGLGGTGFFLGAPRRVESSVTPDIGDRFAITVNRVRAALAGRIREGLAGEPGDVAVALVTGDRSGIDEATAESLRQSGLAHVLAISGLHMALVALTVVAAIRWLLAWSPVLALNYPVRKWAASTGLAAASLYLVISGASVATQRAWIMIAVMLIATLADRRAVTIRNVAVAATVVLLLSPESLLEPGFQMSFAAAAALVAAYEAWTWRVRERGGWSDAGVGHPAVRMARATAGYFSGILFTSLVAGLATGLFAAWHFHRVAPLGLAANALAMPLVTLLVMPLALLSVILMPYGLERLALRPLGWAIERMIAVSDWVNGFAVPGVTGMLPISVIAAGSASLVLLTMLRSRLRLAGLVPLACLPLLFGDSGPPDVLVSEDGRAIAIADAAGGLALLYPRRNGFVSDIWLRAWSGGVEGERSGIDPACDRDLCRAHLPSGIGLEVVYDPDRLKSACLSADILIAPRLRWVNCRDRKPQLIVKRPDLEANGSHAIWIARAGSGTGPPGAASRPAGTSMWVVTARPTGRRPWNQPGNRTNLEKASPRRQ